jgi:hypothetical protein
VVLRVVLVVVLAWIVGAVLVLVLGLLHASHGVTEVQQAKGRLSASDIVSKHPTEVLAAAGREFDAANGLLHSPLLAPLDVVPVLGRQLRSVQDLSSGSAQVVRIGVRAITDARSILHQPHHTGPERVTALRRLAQLATTTDAALSRVDTGPSSALLGPVASKHDTFVRDLADVRTRLHHASAVATSVAGILQGPQNYLLVMANNAEMRAGSGDFLEVGVLSTSDGHLTLGGLKPTVTIPVQPGKVTATGDLAARWGWLKPGQDWRNLGFTPQFDVNGPLAAHMWQAETGQHVDGVLVVDVETLHRLLTVTGPITLPDRTVVTADHVKNFLVHDQYVGLTDNPAGAQAQAEASRQERLGALAKATLDALQNESLDLRSVADAMTAATQGRHLLAWSAQASAENAWRAGGVAGELAGDSTLAAVVNRGGNKLDQYLSVRAELAMSSHGTSTDGTFTVRLHNYTPPGQSQFIAGPYPGLGATYGEYLGLLAVNLPAEARSLRIDGDPPLAAFGAEGPAWVIATPVDLKMGQVDYIVVRFSMPAHGRLTVVPSARLNPVMWKYRGVTHSDTTPFALSW